MQQLIEQYSIAVVIEFVGVSSLGIDLRRHGVRCPANCVGSIMIYLLCMPQIYHRHFSLLVDHKIGSLYVPVNVSVLVKLLQNQAYLNHYQKDKRRVEISDHLK